MSRNFRYVQSSSVDGRLIKIDTRDGMFGDPGPVHEKEGTENDILTLENVQFKTLDPSAILLRFFFFLFIFYKNKSISKYEF